LIIQSATTTHEQLSADEPLLLGVELGLLSLSAGLEHVAEIKGDLSLAFSDNLILFNYFTFVWARYI
jgi:O-acetylhomoserine/O-acetylserine sulfhydrylase